jgi:hypothetical protein
VYRSKWDAFLGARAQLPVCRCKVRSPGKPSHQTFMNSVASRLNSDPKPLGLNGSLFCHSALFAEQRTGRVLYPDKLLEFVALVVFTSSSARSPNGREWCCAMWRSSREASIQPA